MTAKEILKKKGITTATQHHDYQYLYKAVLQAMEEYAEAKSKEGAGERIDAASFLWWLDSYYSRGMIHNKKGKFELHWSNKIEAAELWDSKEAPVYTADELKGMFLAAFGKEER